MRTPRIVAPAPLILVIGALLVGCSSASDKKLDKYATSVLITGAGLGDLQLGETTLSSFRKNVGDGIFSLAVSDESAFEFTFKGGEISFQFLIAGDCSKQIWATRDMRSAGGGLDAYLKKHPACNDVTLSSISVAKKSLGSAFFTGSTDKGAKLGAPITTTMDHGEAKPALPRMMAGLSPKNPDDAIEFPGIVFYYDRGTSGKVEDTLIRRITIYRVDDGGRSTAEGQLRKVNRRERIELI